MRGSHTYSRVLGTLIATLLLLAPSTTFAGGLELSGTGARGMARGGATLAKAEDANVLSHNPAGLAELRGSSMMGDLNITMMDACVDPIGYYGWGLYGGGDVAQLPDPDTGRYEEISETGDNGVATLGDGYYRDPLDTVCMHQAPLPIPQFGITHRVSEDLGVGFGLIFPPVTPSGQWGGDNGVIRGDTGELRPSPVRYLQVSSANIGAFPTVGVGYRLFDELRLGASFQWGVLSVHQQMMVPLAAGSNAAGDILVDVRGVDWFVPAIMGSAHLVPIDAVDVVISGKWQDRIKTDGEVDATTNLFNPTGTPFVNRDRTIKRIEQAMPWKVAVGLRYADRLVPRPPGTGNEEGHENVDDRVHDAMTDEAWDIEFDVEFQKNSMVEDIQVELQQGQTVTVVDGLGNAGTQPFPDAGLEVITIQKQWQDQWVARLGGSWNIAPGVLALHAGAHYETRGVTPAYMNIDFWPVSRVGLHGGMTVRLDRRFDLTFAYGHIMQETIEVAAPPHQVAMQDETFFNKFVGNPNDGGLETLEELNAPSDPDGVASLQQQKTKVLQNTPATIVNAGRYRSSIDVISVGMQYHF